MVEYESDEPFYQETSLHTFGYYIIIRLREAIRDTENMSVDEIHDRFKEWYEAIRTVYVDDITLTKDKKTIVKTRLIEECLEDIMDINDIDCLRKLISLLKSIINVKMDEKLLKNTIKEDMLSWIIIYNTFMDELEICENSKKIMREAIENVKHTLESL